MKNTRCYKGIRGNKEKCSTCGWEATHKVKSDLSYMKGTFWVMAKVTSDNVDLYLHRDEACKDEPTFELFPDGEIYFEGRTMEGWISKIWKSGEKWAL